MLVLFSAFGKTSKLFPIAVLPFYIPINIVLRLQLEKTLAVGDAVKPRIRFQQLCFSSLKWAVVINDQNLTEKSYPFITLQNFFLPLTQGSPIIWKPNYFCRGLPWWLSGKEYACQCRRPVFDPWVGKILWRSKWQPTPVFLPGTPHGQRSLASYSPLGRKEIDVT